MYNILPNNVVIDADGQYFAKNWYFAYKRNNKWSKPSLTTIKNRITRIALLIIPVSLFLMKDYCFIFYNYNSLNLYKF